MPPKASSGTGRARGRPAGRSVSVAPRDSTQPLQTAEATTAQPMKTEAAAAENALGSHPAPESVASSPTVSNVRYVSPNHARTLFISRSSGTSTPSASDSPARPPMSTPQAGAADQASSLPAPARRAGPVRGKKSVMKPTFTGRRSKEERDAWAAEEKKREKAKKAGGTAAAPKQEAKGKGKKERDKAKDGPAKPEAVSGVFSMGAANKGERSTRDSGNEVLNLTADNKPVARVFTSSSRATRVKFEGDEQGSSSGSRPTNSTIKPVDGGTISSDEEGESQYPRYDIDTIDNAVVVSDDDDLNAAAVLRGKGNGRKNQPMLMPVRLQRAPHRDRTIDINSESSNVRSAIKQETTSSTNTDTAEQASRKASKGKSKDVEITEVRKPYKGMWQDTDDPEVQVKEEPMSDHGDDTVTPSEGDGPAPHSLRSAGKQPISSPDDEKKPKTRPANDATAYQTDYDRREEERVNKSLKWMVGQIGTVRTVGQDADGDTAMEGDDDVPKAARDDRSYLIQVPPRMPGLNVLGIKKESYQSEQPTVRPTDATRSTETVVKTEEADEQSSARPAFGQSSGRIGKLRVHKSGRVVLDWGGTTFELAQGVHNSNVQEIVSVGIVPAHERVAEDDGGDTVSFGRIDGKFVTKPDLNKMLGLSRI
jgi:DNA-directed RNA polymerase III subunit RPC4